MERTHRFYRAFGQHLTLDGYGCSQEALADILGVYRFLDRAPAEIAMNKVMEPHVVEYHPPNSPEDWGVTGFVVIAESHIAIHTFPDKLYLSLDIFSCKPFNVREATQLAIDHFKVSRVEVNLLDRGLEFPRNKAMVTEYLRGKRQMSLKG